MDSLYYRSEAVSLTCDDTTDVCSGTELTCTCSVPSPTLIWRLPGPVYINFSVIDHVGSNVTDTNGAFVAIFTAYTGTDLVSLLKYTASDESMNEVIQCEDILRGDNDTILITIAG